jgi:FlaA1/EpsC-like NDP-sugar epimerase
MGEPVRIAYLAEQLILLSGKKPGVDIEIVYRGLRPGEKLHEELFYAEERLADTAHPKILLARSEQPDTDRLESTLAQLDKACRRHDEDAIKALLTGMIPVTGTGTATVAVPVRRSL